MNSAMGTFGPDWDAVDIGCLYLLVVLHRSDKLIGVYGLYCYIIRLKFTEDFLYDVQLRSGKGEVL